MAGDLTNSVSPANPEESSAPLHVRSLRELVDLVTGRNLPAEIAQGDAGLAEVLPYPFLAMVGQQEMKLALLLTLLNPNIGGVLLIGPRGAGKTTAIRSTLDLLPEVIHSTCFYGCTEQDVLDGGMDAVCPDCAKKFGEGKPLTQKERSRLVELPLNARLEDVIGGLDERAAIHERFRLKRGILAQADQNLLFVDEVNLLPNEIINAILDAAAQGSYTVRRGPISATYRARFALIGSMNPEEGSLRPQIMDRFGLRVIVSGLKDPEERRRAYTRVRAFRSNPRGFIQQYQNETLQARSEIQEIRARIDQIALPEEVARKGIALIEKMQIDSLRAEIALFEAARACAAAENRPEVNLEDLRQVAPLCLRQRRSEFMLRYVENQRQEDAALQQMVKQILND